MKAVTEPKYGSLLPNTGGIIGFSDRIWVDTAVGRSDVCKSFDTRETRTSPLSKYR